MSRFAKLLRILKNRSYKNYFLIFKEFLLTKKRMSETYIYIYYFILIYFRRAILTQTNPKKV